jgi:hypothetical protein
LIAVPRIDHGQAVEDPEIVGVASDQLVDSMIEKACSEEGVCNSLSSELIPLDERKSASDSLPVQAEAFYVGVVEIYPSHGEGVCHGDRWGESPSVGDDMYKLVENDGRNDEDHVLVSQLAEKKASDPGVVRQVRHMGIDEDIGIESPPHGCEPTSPSENISS